MRLSNFLGRIDDVRHRQPVHHRRYGVADLRANQFAAANRHARFGALASLRAKIPEGGGWRTVSLRALGAGLRPRTWGDLAPDAARFRRDFFGNVRGLFPIYARDILRVGPQCRLRHPDGAKA